MPTVLILGASSDIGMALATRFASAGYNIQLAARNSGRLQPLCSDLQIRFQCQVTLHEFDATDSGSHETFFRSLAPMPEISICVFGYLGDQKKAEKDFSEATAIIQINFLGAVSILNIISDYYETKKSGTIIGISSVAGERGRMSNYMYGAAKAGFTTYLSGLRNRLHHQKVHVLTVLPGFVNTRMTEHLSLPRVLTASPDEVADKIFTAASKRKNTLHVKWMWKWIMLIIKTIPESIFKKLKM